MSLREGCKEVLKADCVDLAQRLYKAQRRGVKMEDDLKCAICSSNIMEPRPNQNVIAFYCHHVYHQKCLKNAQPEASDEQAPSVAQNAQASRNSMDSPMKLSENDKLWCTVSFTILILPRLCL
jgi:hypothetical protein